MPYKLREKPRRRAVPSEKVWANFQKELSLTEEQLAKFKQYEALLTAWNKSVNLTAIRCLSEMVSRHFVDSLALSKFLDLSKVNLIADVGSGAGFPGVPLKIMFPHLGVILIEVKRKKQQFLRTLINQLELDGIEVCDLDWRTFLRTTQSDVDYFLARASLDPVELCRMFKPGCAYKQSELVYWAAKDWEPDPLIEKFIHTEHDYTIKHKKRKLIVFSLN